MKLDGKRISIPALTNEAEDIGALPAVPMSIVKVIPVMLKNCVPKEMQLASGLMSQIRLPYRRCACRGAA
ncbi:hypothetical protein OJE16_21935 [Pantoea tagorei]